MFFYYSHRVRERDDKTFALSLSYHRQTKHYKIDRHTLPNKDYKLAIEDGPRFDNLMDVSFPFFNMEDLISMNIA